MRQKQRRRQSCTGYSPPSDGASSSEARGEAIVVLSTMIDAMTLARIAAGAPLSEEILKRAKDQLQRTSANQRGSRIAAKSTKT